jgi:CRP/FNR family cyclic AMP-dependent transcriptional regulator
MQSFVSSYGKPEIQTLVDAIAMNKASGGAPLHLSAAQWAVLADYLLPLTLAQDEVLCRQGATDRTLYLVASGSLSVHFEDADKRIQLAILGAGSMVGEGSFFSGSPRRATVQAGSKCVLWSLPPMRFTELSHRKPDLALAITMAAGVVVAQRLQHGQQRIAVT